LCLIFFFLIYAASLYNQHIVFVFVLDCHINANQCVGLANTKS